ncbi:MAG: hypothetical protein LBF79_03025 [Dysgonamonadaceae bacterium]|nr:hypothetical protein [Dysgonamonadaceae bacterium]
MINSIGDSRLDPVFGRQWVLPAVFRSHFLPFTGANRLSLTDVSAETSATS